MCRHTSAFIMEAATSYRGFPRGILPTIMENEMDKKMENETETAII